MNTNSNLTEKEFDKIIGTRLKALRIAKGLSQTELGSRIGISFQQIQKCEKGSNRIGSGRLWQFCEVLGTTSSQFFSELENAQGQSRKPKIIDPEWSSMLTRQNHRLVKNFMKIENYTHKVSLLRICEGLANDGDY